MNEVLKPYLARSAGVHLVAGAAFLLLAARQGAKPSQTYMIDFVGGPAAVVTGSAPAGAAAAAREASAPAAVAQQADPDSVAVHGKRHGPIVLPRPSLLHGGGRDADAGSSPTASSSLAGPGAAGPASAAGTPGASGTGGGSGASAGAGVATDLPNFPYPWYISQVRLMLWQAWQKRMPRTEADGAVAFSILRNGSFTDLSIESSSGDSDFDKAAIESVQAAAPFPALPSDFAEPFLKIHLSLKSDPSWR